ncbi:uncharacterized protein CEXT_155571 [Caerostris extrusa]|uniref:Fibronectin type-III domain-containing protein n=1 Tax=Caerostris extrusa TaxID=172846 RepID=A0AAV4X9C3_CAEEX|nr:uncharacterized protein CEXT_155571 [Caerostris extrusa]
MLYTSKTLKLSWEPNNHLNAPISGYILYHKTEGNHWQETHLTGDRTAYTLHDLQCGSSYSFYLVAFNSAGRGNGSEIISARTDGSLAMTIWSNFPKQLFLGGFVSKDSKLDISEDVVFG